MIKGFTNEGAGLWLEKPPTEAMLIQILVSLEWDFVKLVATLVLKPQILQLQTEDPFGRLDAVTSPSASPSRSARHVWSCWQATLSRILLSCASTCQASSFASRRPKTTY